MMPQQAQGGFFMPSMEEQGQVYRIAGGIDPRAQQPPTAPGIMDWINAAMNIRSAADKREQDRLSWEDTNRQFDEMLRQFEMTSGATADWRQAQLGQGYAQMAQTGAYQQQGIEQQWAQMEMQRQQAAAALAQRKQEMGASIGQGIAGMQSQQWAQGRPWALPSGTQFAPGMGPGGPVSEMARRSGVSYTPPSLAKAPPPSSKQMEDWINAAIAKFGQ